MNLGGSQSKNLRWYIRSAFVVWLKPIEFTKVDQNAFIVINTLVINFFVLLTVWPETLVSGVSPWIPALFGVFTATPLTVIFMTFGGNSLREILKLRSEMEAVSNRLATQNAELEATKTELNRLANCDGLTGLANRRSFSIALDEACDVTGDDTGQTWLAMLDLDGFKAINDTYGHDAGDTVLITVAERLQKIMKDMDATIARFGGDEFAIILRQRECLANDLAERRVRSLCSYLTVGHTYEGHDLDVGVSVGLAKFDASFDGTNTFLKAADAALLKAKANGKGKVCRHGADDVRTPKLRAGLKFWN